MGDAMSSKQTGTGSIYPTGGKLQGCYALLCTALTVGVVASRVAQRLRRTWKGHERMTTQLLTLPDSSEASMPHV